LGGGERLKFGDVVAAVASLVVINLLLISVLLVVFVPMISIDGILSILVASSIVGYVFALKIQEESRPKAI
jgi:hypothetical protein